MNPHDPTRDGTSGHTDAPVGAAPVDAAPVNAAAAERLAALSRRRSGSPSRDRLAPPEQYRGVPDVAWYRNPTMWLGVATLLGWSVGWVGYLSGVLPAAVAILVNATATYLGFTVFHESVHRAAHVDRRVNDLIGWVPAAMLTFAYPVFRICHLNHHAHTNDPERDPDHYVSHRPRWLLPLWLLGTAVHYRILCHRHEWGTLAQRRAQKAVDTVLLGGTLLAAVTGHLVPVVVLFWAPSVLAGIVLFWAFDFLPHTPFDSTERYHDTRIQPGRIRHAVLLGQNYHLIHHLWVSVPWFHYRDVFDELEPELRERGARIE